MGAVDRRAELLEDLAQILARQTLGEMLGYDIGPAILPTPQGLQVGYQVMISCRSPVLQPPRLAASHFIAHGWPSSEQLEEAVKQCLAGLAAIRSKLLSAPSPFSPQIPRQPQGGNHRG